MLFCYSIKVKIVLAMWCDGRCRTHRRRPQRDTKSPAPGRFYCTWRRSVFLLLLIFNENFNVLKTHGARARESLLSVVVVFFLPVWRRAHAITTSRADVSKAFRPGIFCCCFAPIFPRHTGRKPAGVCATAFWLSWPLSLPAHAGLTNYGVLPNSGCGHRTRHALFIQEHLILIHIFVFLLCFFLLLHSFLLWMLWQILPRRLDWTGIEHEQTFAELVSTAAWANYIIHILNGHSTIRDLCKKKSCVCENASECRREGGGER